MTGQGRTYFTPEQCLNSHFVITGMTNDVFCGESLVPQSLREELSLHLRKQGFDAVIFMDNLSMLHCYDSQSWEYLRQGRITREPAAPSHPALTDGISGKGAAGRRMRRRAGAAAQPAPQQTPSDSNAAVPESLNLGAMRAQQAWTQLSALLSDPVVRCAVVFPNADTQFGEMPAYILNVLETLGSGQTENNPIAVYVYPDTSFADGMRSKSGSGILPFLSRRIFSTNAAESAVLYLGAPNAAEVRNLLNWMRQRQERPVRFRKIGALAQALSAFASRQSHWHRPLSALQARIEEYVNQHAGQTPVIGPENLSEVLQERIELSAMEELNQLVGLREVKESFENRLKQYQLKGFDKAMMPDFACRLAPPPRIRLSDPNDLNYMLIGPTGTGKTTVASLIGRLLFECGVLRDGHLVERSAGNLISQNVGGTAPLVSQAVREALGGVLFIDEAYALVTTQSRHGQEAVDQLVAEMSAHAGELSVVVAGYEQEMDQFRRANQGLPGRFPAHNVMVLPEYRGNDLKELLFFMAARDPDGVRFAQSFTEQTVRGDGKARSKMDDFCDAWRDAAEGEWKNAREVRELLTVMKQTHYRRTKNVDYELSEPDIPSNLQECLKPRSQSREEAWDEIDKLIGLDNVKVFLKRLARDMAWATEKRAPGNYIFSGPPGTGKTFTANLMGGLLQQIGVINRRHVTERKAADLLEGDPVQNLNDAVDAARGGVLFIDEAHQLLDTNVGRVVLRALVPLIEAPENRQTTAFILAGYTAGMSRLLREDDGFNRRFPEDHRIRFVNYTAKELRGILEKFAADQHEIPTEAYLDRSEVILSEFLLTNPRNFGNAGFIRDVYLPGSISVRSARLNQKVSKDGRLADQKTIERYENPEEKRELTELDVPPEYAIYAKPGARPPKNAGSLEQAMADVEKLRGLKNVKSFLRGLARDVVWGSGNGTPGNYIFFGPSGSGKTYAASLMGRILHQLGLLKRDTVYEISAGSLMKDTPNEIADALQVAIDESREGVLFIDEAHQLKDNAAGKTVLRQLVPLIEHPGFRMDTAVILAGYEHEITQLLKADDGLNSRFPVNHRIRFTDYSAHELRLILEDFAAKRGEEATEEYLDRSEVVFCGILERRDRNFGNARFVRDVYLVDSLAARAERLNRALAGSDALADPGAAAQVDEPERRRLTAQDVPAQYRSYAPPEAKPAGELSALERMRQELIGKQELLDFAAEFCREEESDGPVFLDSVGSRNLCYAISGPIGTGKRSAIRMISRVLLEQELIDGDFVRFAGKGDFEAKFIGHTAERVQNIINETAGNTLVVMNPSSMLARSDGRDITFGPDVFLTLLGNMGAANPRTCFVFLDSEEGMEQFLSAYPAFRSLLARCFKTEDFTPDEMLRLFELQTKSSYRFDEALRAQLPGMFRNWVSQRGGLGDKWKSWGNGTELETLIRLMKRNWEKSNREPVMVDGVPMREVSLDMIPEQYRKYAEKTAETKQSAFAELDALIGMRSAKEAVRDIERRIRFRGEGQVAPGHYCFLGNPGTGKTTLARLMGSILRNAGALSQGHVVERKTMDLLGRPDYFDESLKLAKNGILFIDEAHQLAQYEGGQAIIQSILRAVEDAGISKNTCLILAGYQKQMMQMLSRDSGLQSRFGTKNSLVVFDDYTPDELIEIMHAFAGRADKTPEIGAKQPLAMTEGFVAQSSRIAVGVCAMEDPNFGNARWVRNYLHDCVGQMLRRMDRGGSVEQDPLRPQDIPGNYTKLLRYARRLEARITPDKLDTAPSAFSEEDIRRLSPAVVLLEIFRNGDCIGSGTGTVISEDGLILTCRHVAEVQGEIIAYLRVEHPYGTKPLKLSCTRMYPMSEKYDMALLKVDGHSFPHAALRPASEPIEPDERTLLFGFSLGNLINEENSEKLEPTRYIGTMGSVQTMKNGVEHCYMDSRGTKGDSGSPVFSYRDGRVIGVFTGSIKPDYEEINYFHPIKYFWQSFVHEKKEDDKA